MNSPFTEKAISPQELAELLFGPAFAQAAAPGNDMSNRITPIGPARYSEDCDCPTGVCLGSGEVGENTLSEGFTGEPFKPYEVGLSEAVEDDGERLFEEDRAIVAAVSHATAQYGEALNALTRLVDRVLAS